MRRIGELLVAEGLLTEGAVERALGFQRLASEHIRLGSILLNWDLLGEEALLGALARLHRCPAVPWSLLSAAPIEAVRILPAAHAIRFAAMPYEAGRSLVRVAFVDPGDLTAIDEVARIAGRRIAPGVTTEVRMMQAQQRFYGRHVPLEYRAILQKMERRSAGPRRVASAPDARAVPVGAQRVARAGSGASPGVAIEISPAGAAPPGSPIPIPEPAVSDLPLPETEMPEIFTGEDSLAKWVEDALSAFRDPAWNPGRPSTRVVPPDRALPRAPRLGTSSVSRAARVEPLPDERSRPPADPVADMWRDSSAADSDSGISRMWTGAASRSTGERAGTREELVEEVIRTMLASVPRVVVLGRGTDSITGWRGKGPDVTLERVLSLRIPLEDSTVFSRVLATGHPHSGPVGERLWPRTLADLLGSDPPDCAVLPIQIRGRMAAFLYADRIDQPLQREDLARLARAAAAIASALSPPRSSSAPARSE